MGTFNNGLWIYENDVWSHFTVAEGLPSNRIVGITTTNLGIANAKQSLLVATDFGLSIQQENRFYTTQTLPMLSGLVKHENQIYLSRENGEIYRVNNSIQKFTQINELQNTHLNVTDKKLWVFGNLGVWQLNGAQVNKFNQFNHF